MKYEEMELCKGITAARQSAGIAGANILECAPNIALIDIPEDRIGIVALLTNAHELHRRMGAVVRRVYNSQMAKVIEQPNNCLEWKKLLLLPVVLFCKKVDLTIRASMIESINLINANRWDLITLDRFELKLLKQEDIMDVEDAVARAAQKMEARASELMAKGMASKAHRLVTRESIPGRIESSAEEKVQQLRDMHPPVGPHNVSDETINKIRTFRALPEQRIDVDAIKVRNIINKANFMVTAGIDKIQMEHLKILIGVGDISKLDEQEFAKRLTKVIEFIVNAEVPDETMPAIRDIELLGLPKGVDKVRPIGLNTMLRKIASIVVEELTSKPQGADERISFAERYFKDLQFQGRQNGTEIVIGLTTGFVDRNKSFDLFAMDAANGFNAASRITGLANILELCPRVLPFYRSMYGPDYVTHAFYRTQDNGIEVIDVLEGATQGDVCSTFFYSMMIHEFVKKVDAQTTPNCRGFTGFFVDDGNLVADHASMLLKVKYVLQEGPKVGYHLQTKKGALLLGLCDSYDEALGRKNAYVDLGISPDIIKIHPDNLRQLTDSTDIEAKSAEYGAKILGAYIGSEAYVTSQFQAKTQELREAAQKICGLKDNQMKCLLLTKCFSHKVTYLQRTHSPDTPGLANLLTEFTGFQKDIVCSMLNDPNHEWWSPNNLPDIIFRQMQLHIKDSGLGLGFQDEIANIAYVASIVDVLPTMRKFWPEIDADMDEDGGQHFQAFRRALRHVQNIVEDPDLDADFLRKLSRSDLVKAGETTVQNFLSSKIRSPLKSRFIACLSGDHLKWVQSLDSSTAGLWLTAMPKSTGTRMDSGSFTAALIIRFRLPAPYYVFGSARCTCYNRTLLDEYGYHLTMGCGKDGFRNKAHNAVQRILRDACVLSGYPTKLEERGAFQANNPDCNMRPDLTVIGAPIKGPVKLLLDVSITHPLGRAR